MQMEAKIREIIAEIACCDLQDASDESTLTSDLAMDSLDLAKLAVELESQFDIEVADSSVRGDMTVRQVIDEVKSLL